MNFCAGGGGGGDFVKLKAKLNKLFNTIIGGNIFIKTTSIFPEKTNRLTFKPRNISSVLSQKLSMQR